MSLPPWLADRAGTRGLGPLIDHTLLRAEATADELGRLCEEALRAGFWSVCVNPQWVALCAARLRDSRVKVASVVGFPLGASGAVSKAVQARLAVADGADELDVVAPIGWVRSGRWDEVEDELRLVTQAAAGRLVKLILETAVLTAEEMRQTAELARQAGIGMLKTSTGFHSAGGATVEAVRLLRELGGTSLGVKASGGVRTPEDAIAMLRAGADRLGTSSAAGWPVVGDHAPPLEVLLG